MNDRQRDLDRRIRRAQRQEFLRMLWDARMVIGIGAVIVGGLVLSTMYNSTQPQLDKTILAHVIEDSGVITTPQGTQYRRETVALNGGGTVKIDVPGADPIPESAAIKVEIYRKDWGPLHQVTYKFGGYDDEAATPS